MSIKVGEKQILSLPEQVAKNSRRIEALEKKELTHLFYYGVYLEKNNETNVFFSFYSCNDYDTVSEITDLYEIIYEECPATKHALLASGYSAGRGDPIASINMQSFEDDNYELTIVTVSDSIEAVFSVDVNAFNFTKKQLL